MELMCDQVAVLSLSHPCRPQATARHRSTGGAAHLCLSVSTFASLPGTGLSLTSPRTTCDRNHTGDSLSPLKSTTGLSSVGCVRAPL